MYKRSYLGHLNLRVAKKEIIGLDVTTLMLLLL